MKKAKAKLTNKSPLDLLSLLACGLRWFASQVRLGRCLLALTSGVGTS